MSINLNNNRSNFQGFNNNPDGRAILARPRIYDLDHPNESLELQEGEEDLWSSFSDDNNNNVTQDQIQQVAQNVLKKSSGAFKLNCK